MEQKKRIKRVITSLICDDIASAENSLSQVIFDVSKKTLGLNEGMFVVKNLDGKEKRFKDTKSAEAKAWAKTSSAKKPVSKKYSYEWWDESDAETLPWSPFRQDKDAGSVADIVAKQFNSRADWTLGSVYAKQIDDVLVTAMKIRVSYEYSPEDDMGLDADTGDSQVIGVRRDEKNPEKWHFDKFF